MNLRLQRYNVPEMIHNTFQPHLYMELEVITEEIEQSLQMAEGGCHTMNLLHQKDCIMQMLCKVTSPLYNRDLFFSPMK
jgi:hypothetical protein